MLLHTTVNKNERFCCSFYSYVYVYLYLYGFVFISNDVVRVAGERSEDQEDILQEQGVQEAHLAQGHPVQEGKG